MINNNIIQVKNFKDVTTDQDFIKFMEQLEIIKIDMESFGHIEDMTNTLAITEIEMRLLDNVKKD